MRSIGQGIISQSASPRSHHVGSWPVSRVLLLSKARLFQGCPGFSGHPTTSDTRQFLASNECVHTTPAHPKINLYRRNTQKIRNVLTPHPNTSPVLSLDTGPGCDLVPRHRRLMTPLTTTIAGLAPSATSRRLIAPDHVAVPGRWASEGAYPNFCCVMPDPPDPPRCTAPCGRGR
jgi:hypothetical protein